MLRFCVRAVVDDCLKWLIHRRFIMIYYMNIAVVSPTIYYGAVVVDSLRLMGR